MSNPLTPANVYIAEGWQPDCDGPVRWLESITADSLKAAKDSTVPVFDSSGDLCPEAVYTVEEAIQRFGRDVITRMFSRELGRKESGAAGASHVADDDPNGVPFYYINLNR